jgi:hypothetical protein
VLVHANVFFARRTRPSEDARIRAPEGSGPPDADETGENHASRRVSHFSDRTSDHGVAFSSASCAGLPLASDSPVASSELVNAGCFLASTRGGSKAAEIGSAGAS